jgi:hypothetical protein
MVSSVQRRPAPTKSNQSGPIAAPAGGLFGRTTDDLQLQECSVPQAEMQDRLHPHASSRPALAQSSSSPYPAVSAPVYGPHRARLTCKWNVGIRCGFHRDVTVHKELVMQLMARRPLHAPRFGEIAAVGSRTIGHVQACGGLRCAFLAHA